MHSNDEYYVNPYNDFFRHLELESAWALLQSQHPVIDVAVLSYPVDPNHPDLDCVGPNCYTSSLTHGTEVAGLIGAISHNGIGVSGVARNHVRIVVYPRGVYYIWETAKNGAKVMTRLIVQAASRIK